MFVIYFFIFIRQSLDGCGNSDSFLSLTQMPLMSSPGGTQQWSIQPGGARGWGGWRSTKDAVGETTEDRGSGYQGARRGPREGLSYGWPHAIRQMPVSHPYMPTPGQLWSSQHPRESRILPLTYSYLEYPQIVFGQRPTISPFMFLI